MEFLKPKINFAPQKPFHGLVVAYLAQVHGLLDLFTRGLREGWMHFKSTQKSPLPPEDELIEVFCTGVTNDYSDQIRSVLKSESGALIGVQRLGSIFNDGIKVDTQKLSQELFNEYKKPVSAFATMSAGSLLILAWESTLEFHTKDPLWEFLRHCRNASAHNSGRFNFLYDEPKRKAQWRSQKIVPNLQGTKLFKDIDAQGFINPGDALYLLADIEQKFI